MITKIEKRVQTSLNNKNQITTLIYMIEIYYLLTLYMIESQDYFATQLIELDLILP